MIKTVNVGFLQDANEESKSVTKASAMKGKLFCPYHLQLEDLYLELDFTSLLFHFKLA